MVEDVLEQVIDDWLRWKGFFTQHNVKFKPEQGDPGYSSQAHNQPSDIDVLAIHPNRRGRDRVWAVSCKAMQQGFSPNGWLAAAENNRTYCGRRRGASRSHLRELWDPVWNAAHRRVVRDLTGANSYTYVLAVTRMDRGGDRDTSLWAEHDVVGPHLEGLAHQVLTFGELWQELREHVTERVEPSHIGRLAQMLNAVERGQ